MRMRQALRVLDYPEGPTSEQAHVGLAGLEGTARLAQHLLPVLLQCGHLRSDRGRHLQSRIPRDLRKNARRQH